MAIRVWFSVCRLPRRVLSCAVCEAEGWSWVVRVEIWDFREGISAARVVWVAREVRRVEIRASDAGEGEGEREVLVSCSPVQGRDRFLLGGGEKQKKLP